MKIEKINDNQIRCTLNPQDLAERHLKLSEFAYGSGKAKELFRDMMEKASEEQNFDAENMPLMIEAIPTSAESLVLIITKVDNPEEIDTRFSSFTPYHKEETEEEEEDRDDVVLPGLNHLDNNVLETLRKRVAELTAEDGTVDKKKAEATVLESKCFRFRSLDNLVAFAKAVRDFYSGPGVLYRIDKDRSYLLCFFLLGTTARDFNRMCNIACEYGEMLPKADILFCQEHYACLMTDDVIAQLSDF